MPASNRMMDAQRVAAMASSKDIVHFELTSKGVDFFKSDLGQFAGIDVAPVGTTDAQLLTRDINDEWLARAVRAHSNGSQTLYNYIHFNMSHATIGFTYPNNLGKRNGYNGYTDSVGHEVLVQSESYDTVAYWNDVINWSDTPNSASDNLVLELNAHEESNLFAGVYDSCMCDPTPQPVKIKGCWIAYVRLETGYAARTDINDSGFCETYWYDVCDCTDGSDIN